LAPPGSSWPFLASPGHSWPPLAPPGRSERLLASPGLSLPLKVPPWRLIADIGPSWLPIFLRGVEYISNFGKVRFRSLGVLKLSLSTQTQPPSGYYIDPSRDWSLARKHIFLDPKGSKTNFRIIQNSVKCGSHRFSESMQSYYGINIQHSGFENMSFGSFAMSQI
jgi:hypothetical protein